ncbi:hypothetical protein BC835DRAFT_1418530 [Cytidiella melzeri]|nr:hypothetical protein BC835DRAFT_1418530 [Cytidiella melzeri]
MLEKAQAGARAQSATCNEQLELSKKNEDALNDHLVAAQEECSKTRGRQEELQTRLTKVLAQVVALRQQKMLEEAQAGAQAQSATHKRQLELSRKNEDALTRQLAAAQEECSKARGRQEELKTNRGVGPGGGIASAALHHPATGWNPGPAEQVAELQ